MVTAYLLGEILHGRVLSRSNRFSWIQTKRNDHNFLSYKTLYDQEYLELSANH